MKVINEIKNIKMTKVERTPEELSMVVNKIKVEKIEQNGEVATASVRILYKDKNDVVYKVTCFIDMPNKEEIIDIFKDWVENNRGWNEVLNAPRKTREKAIQRLIHLSSMYYLEVNNLHAAYESNAGNGSSDVVISRGCDKTIIEIKLSTNGQYLHAYKLEFVHPITHKKMEFEAPLPEYFKNYLETLR